MLGSLKSKKIIIGSLESEIRFPQVDTGYLTFSLIKNCFSACVSQNKVRECYARSPRVIVFSYVVTPVNSSLVPGKAANAQ